jgi:hypothetical protein
MLKFTPNVVARIFLDMSGYYWTKAGWAVELYGPDDGFNKSLRLAIKTRALISHDKYLVEVDEKGLLHPKSR